MSHAFDYSLRIALQNASIHERAGIAFVAVADHVFQVAHGLGHSAPLQGPSDTHRRRDRAARFLRSR